VISRSLSASSSPRTRDGFFFSMGGDFTIPVKQEHPPGCDREVPTGGEAAQTEEEK